MKKHLALSVLLLSLISLSGWAQNGDSQNSMESAFDSTGQGLTDQEMENARNFNHAGYTGRKIEEGCKDKKVDCAPGSADPSGLMGALEQNMGKAYSMLFGGLAMMSGDGGPKTKMGKELVDKVDDNGNKVFTTDEAGNKVAEKTEQDKETNDYCMYGAMAWETIAMFMQNAHQDNISKETANIKDDQVKALVNLKKQHEARAKTSTWQAAAYGAVTACYAGYAIAGGYSDPMLYAKGGGALALSIFFGVKAHQHGKAADLIQQVIDGLPKAGDCNPWTGTTCFCKEKSSEQLYPGEYQTQCVLKIAERELPGPVGCGVMSNGKMVFDKECKCKQNKSCFRAQVKIHNPKFKVGNNVLGMANKGYDLMASGEYDHAKLTAYSTEARALGLKAMSKFKPKTGNLKLTDQQKKEAVELSKILPPEAAAMLAASPAGNSPVGLGIGSTASLSKLPPKVKKEVAEAIKGNYNQGSGYGGAAEAKEETPSFAMPSFGQEAAAPDSTEVLSFAEKAVNNADVNNSPDTPIFDIISNRYRRSGWKKVESTEMQQ